MPSPITASPDRIVTVFRRRRLRQQLVVVPAVLGMVALVWVHETAAAGELAEKDPFAVGAFAVVVLSLAFSWWNWRCPACRTPLGRGTSPRRCPECGAPFA